MIKAEFWDWQPPQQSTTGDASCSRPEFVRIGAHLKSLYEPAVQESLPEGIARLLDHRVDAKTDN
jgi:hypothetical protein